MILKSTLHTYLVIAFICSNLSSCSGGSNDITDKNLEKPQILHPSDKQIHNDLLVSDALEALTTIQTNGDGNMTLYLTFPNINHEECKGNVSLLEISQQELYDVLIDVMSHNNKTLSDSTKHNLALTATQPANNYLVTICDSFNQMNHENPNSLTLREGTWVIPAIFGEKDLLINW